VVKFEIFKEGEVGNSINSTDMSFAPVMIKEGSVIDNGVPAD
jgi:hypothetical protein